MVAQACIKWYRDGLTNGNKSSGSVSSLSWGESPRAMSPHILFYMAAQLALSNDVLTQVLDKMREIGGEVN